jgi:hypothetical protein
MSSKRHGKRAIRFVHVDAPEKLRQAMTRSVDAAFGTVKEKALKQGIRQRFKTLLKYPVRGDMIWS